MLKLIKPSTYRTLRARITLLTCGLTMIAALTLGTFAYRQTVQATINTAMDGLGWETRLIAQKFEDSFDEMRSDVEILRQIPPVTGLYHSLRESGPQTAADATPEAWGRKIQQSFKTIMRLRPHYTQIRIIGLSEGGPELVRVNRTSDGLQGVEPEDLQLKGAEPYFLYGAALGRGQTHISEVTYNREHGAIHAQSVPTIRIIAPVVVDGDKFAIAVINVDYFGALETIAREINPTKALVVTNHAGDYLLYEGAAGGRVSVALRTDASYAAPGFIEPFNESQQNEDTYIDASDIAYFVRVNVDIHNPDSFLGIVLDVPRAKLLASSLEAQHETLLIAGVLIVGCLCIALFGADQLTAPVRRMTEQITATPAGHAPEDLPIHRHDELGDLARSFQALTRRLRRSESQARAVLDTVVDGIITISETGKVLSFNPACQTIFGYQASEVEGKNVSLLMPSSDATRHDAYLKGFDPVRRNTVIGKGRDLIGLRKDGSTFSMELSVSETLIEDGRLFTGILRDVTARKQMEVMKDEFVSTVNHELRTPLTSIRGALGLLKVKMAGNLDDKTRRLLDLSYDNCARLAHLVNDILDMEKIAAGKIEYRMETVEISELVDEIVDRHQSYAEMHGVNFRVNKAPEPAFCRLDTSRFNQALVNLLSNASKFSPKGSDVVFDVQWDGLQSVRISVTDSGPGIPEDFIPKIFEKFAQADSSTTRNSGGTGLGLSITKAIIEAFDGTVSFTTKQNVGTTFSIVLPAMPDAPEERLAS